MWRLCPLQYGEEYHAPVGRSGPSVGCRSLPFQSLLGVKRKSEPALDMTRSTHRDCRRARICRRGAPRNTFWKRPRKREYSCWFAIYRENPGLASVRLDRHYRSLMVDGLTDADRSMLCGARWGKIGRCSQGHHHPRGSVGSCIGALHGCGRADRRHAAKVYF